MRGRLVKNISANILQQVINQLFGLIIFYILSRDLNKEAFGEINWCLAFLLTSFTILSFGLDQLTIKKIAAGENPSSVLSLYLTHSGIAGLLFYGLTAIVYLLFPLHTLLLPILLLGIGKLMIFFSMPFKQAAIGLEKFPLFASMSVVSNIIRGTALIVGSVFYTLNINLIIFIFIAGDAAELLMSVVFYYRTIKIPVKISFNKQAYKILLKEAFPQIGIVLSTSVMARFDWLFIGLMISTVQLAEYSFAYKVFEISTLPMLVIAPILIPRFVKHFQQKKKNSEEIYALIKIEMIICMLVIVLINIAWVPIIDTITGGKYGAANSNTIFILSLCTPLLYLNNVLWTAGFAQGNLRSIFFIISITCCLNIAGDCLFIPLFKKEGATAAYLLALIIQTILYFKKEHSISFSKVSYNITTCILSGILSIYIIKQNIKSAPLSILSGIILYATFVLLSQKLKTKIKNKYNIA